MEGALNVVAIGSSQLIERIRTALFHNRRFSLLVADNYWELCLLPRKEAHLVSVAVLEHLNPGRELRRKAEYIRRRWPDAQIILVGNHAAILEDQLYDERVPSGVRAEELLEVIERLLKHKRRLKQMRARHVPRFDAQRSGQKFQTKPGHERTP